MVMRGYAKTGLRNEGGETLLGGAVPVNSEGGPERNQSEPVTNYRGRGVVALIRSETGNPSCCALSASRR